MALWKIIPPEEGSDLCHRFVMHGRVVRQCPQAGNAKMLFERHLPHAREAAGQQAEP